MFFFEAPIDRLTLLHVDDSVQRQMIMDAQKSAKGVELKNQAHEVHIEDCYVIDTLSWPNGSFFNNYYPRFEQSPNGETNKF